MWRLVATGIRLWDEGGLGSRGRILGKGSRLLRKLLYPTAQSTIIQMHILFAPFADRRLNLAVRWIGSHPCGRFLVMRFRCREWSFRRRLQLAGSLCYQC